MSNSLRFQGEKTALTTLVQRERWLPKKPEGYEAWNVHSVNKTEPPPSRSHQDFCLLWELTGWRETRVWRFHWAGPAHWHRGEPPPMARLLQARPCWSCCCDWDALGTAGTCLGTPLGQWMVGRGHGFDQPMPGTSPKAFDVLYVMCDDNAVNIQANFWCRMGQSFPANGNVSFIAMHFPVSKHMLPIELKGNPVHLVSGIEQKERPQHC